MDTQPVRCIDRGNFRLQQAGEMARVGFGLCAKATDVAAQANFRSSVYPRRCQRFELAAENIRASRVAWYAVNRVEKR